MKQIIVFIFLFVLSSCDHQYCGIIITNLSFKDLYIIQSKDSVLNTKTDFRKWAYSNITNNDTSWDNKMENYIKVGDSLTDCLIGYKKAYQDYLEVEYPNKLIYFFILDKEIFRNYSWDSIIKKKMYENVLCFTIDSLKKLNWKVVYKGKYSITDCN